MLGLYLAGMEQVSQHLLAMAPKKDAKVLIYFLAMTATMPAGQSMGTEHIDMGLVQLFLSNLRIASVHTSRVDYYIPLELYLQSA